MLHLNDLVGRAIVDLEKAEKVGHVDDVVLDPEGCRVAALVVGSGQSFLGGGTRSLIDAASVHSIGPDAVTIHGAGLPVEPGGLEHLPRRRDVVGRKVVGQTGKMFGHIRDVLIEPGDGRILGYAMEDNPLSGLENILTGSRPRMKEFLRADADLRVGPDLVVVPDEAVVSADSAVPSTPGPEGWSARGIANPGSAWVRNATPPPALVRGSVPPSEEAPVPDSPPTVLEEEPIAYEEMVAPPIDAEVR